MENLSRSVLVIILLVWNIITFLMYGADKFLAQNNMYRISEKILLGCAAALGGVGAYAGMMIFRHKTKHSNFKILLPIFALITVFALFKIK